ncbi:NAD(P)H-binding protein [Actinomadura keratinilytica]
MAAAVRTPARAASLAARGVEIRTADYDRPRTLRTALAGATKVLLVSSTGPDEVRVAQHRAVIDAAREAGVELFAYTSVTDAPANPMGLARVHRDTEAALAASGLPVALLRNGWYTENHTGTLRDAVARGVLAGSAGTGRIAFASRAELAEAAARVLTLDGQGGRVYDLTGDTAWTLAEGAAEAAAQTGTPVAYQDLPPEAYHRLLTQAGLRHRRRADRRLGPVHRPGRPGALQRRPPRAARPPHPDPGGRRHPRARGVTGGGAVTSAAPAATPAAPCRSAP